MARQEADNHGTLHLTTTLARQWEKRIRRVSVERADAFLHYISSMASVFRALSRILKPGAPAVFVVGHSTWNSVEIPTSELFQEISAGLFSLGEVLRYPIKNRYMSYTRHNGADIAAEYVLVLRRTRTRLGELKGIGAR